MATAPGTNKRATRPLITTDYTPAMVNGDASSSSSKGSKRKAVNSTAVAGKKQKTVAQAGSPEWPSYFRDVRQLSASGKITSY